MKEIGADDDFIHAVCSHGWSICVDVEPVKRMEKVLFTIDEIGDKLGLTRERVRQIKEKAIKQLRDSGMSRQLKAYLG